MKESESIKNGGASKKRLKTRKSVGNPYRIRKTYKKNCYQLKNKHNKHSFTKCSSLENVIKQDKLLRALLYNPSFIRK